MDTYDGWDVTTLDHLECGPALIELGDAEGYERFRRAAIARFSNAEYPVADRIVKVSLLLPADAEVIRSLESLVQVTLRTFNVTENPANEDSFRAAWQCISLALMEYRRGNFTSAAEWCRRCLAYTEYNAPRIATARVILAMSCQHLRLTQEARSELARGREAIEARFKTGLDRGSGTAGFWFDWVFARVLLREATALIEGPARPAEASPKAR